MTREEAIKSLQNIIEYWTYKPTEVEAAKMAIAALHPVSREQVERMRGEWINTNKEVEQMCKCSKCGYPISYFWSRTPFCPNCGAPMTDEAVDMVLKRLEVPKDDQT
jgi:hypothetical protein